MATSYEQISEWFDMGWTDAKLYMIVWCDEYDHSDYPVYYDDEESAQLALNNPGSMQRAMECYNLEYDKDSQMNLPRAWALKRNKFS